MAAVSVEEQAAMRESFRRLLTQHSAEADVRRTMASESGFEPALWRQLAEMGLTGLIVDTEYGGAGAGPAELEIIMEEAGAALYCGPFLSSAVLAAALVSHSTDTDAKARLLPAIASGQRIATVALTGERGLWTPDDVNVTAARSDQGWQLDGSAAFVTYGAEADILLVVARTDEGLAGFEVDPTAAGVARQPLQTFDKTQRMARIVFQAAPAQRIDGVDADAIEATLNVARVALAGEQAGAARRVFDLTVDYIKNRVQFGRPIGGFQAIKHMAADLLVEVESATSAARHAGRALADDGVDADELVNLAAFTCADTFSQVAATSVQMHGGVAFTWEHPAHLYLRRARADAQLFGGSDFYRERYLSILETSNV